GAALSPDAFVAAGFGGMFQHFAAAVVLGYAALHGAFTLGPLPSKRQRYVAAMAATCLAAAICYVLKARFGDERLTLPATVMDHALAGVFALFLLADLVVFHRNYFKEKASRIELARESGQHDARVELGRTVQRMLLPK